MDDLEVTENEIPLDDEEDNFQTVELNSGVQKPVLTFEQDSTPPTIPLSSHLPTPISQSSEATPTAVSNNVDTLQSSGERTRLQGRSGKTLSANAGIFREWSIQQYKVTKQVLSERLGGGLKTVDPDLEHRLNSIRDTQRKYNQLISLSGQLQTHFQNVVETQRALAEHFAFLSIRCPELHTEFDCNAESQKKISRNGETLLSSLQFFIANLHTVSTKSIEDTLFTAKNYETARVLFDAYRTDLEHTTKAANTSQAATARLPAVKDQFDKQKKRFEQLRHDLDVKLKLLDENRLKVMQRQLVLLHGAFAAYFSGNHTVMESLVQEFHTKLEENRQRNNDPPSWLEDLPTDRGDEETGQN